MLKAFLFATALVLAGTAKAQSQGLPSEIADPYRSYTQAIEAGDMESAREHARQAWQAAERLSYNQETTLVLADNYAQLALRSQEFDEAVRAFKRTSELLAATESDTFTLAQTWMLAAHAALSGGDYRDARRSADIAGDMAQNSDDLDDAQRADLVFTSRAIQAVGHWSDGNMRPAFARAREAMDAGGDTDFSGSPYYGLTTFVLGATHSVLRDSEEAAYWLTVAYHHMPAEQDALYWWSRYSRDQLTEREREALLDRLSTTTLPSVPETDATTARQEAWERRRQLLEQDGFTDAEPLRRNEPQYPSNAAAAGIEGIAVIEFTVNEDGEVEDEQVVMSVPVRDFGEVGERAVRRWRYQPASLKGEPVERPGVTVEFRFTLSD